MKNKKIFLLVLAIIATHSFAQNCNYKTINQNGVLLKQFNPMPIGNDNKFDLHVKIKNLRPNYKRNALLSINGRNKYKKSRASQHGFISDVLLASRTGYKPVLITQSAP